MTNSFEFGFENKSNASKAAIALKKSNIKYNRTTGGGIYYFIFNSNSDLNKAVKVVTPLIDKVKETEW